MPASTIKRRDVIEMLLKNGAVLVREGGNHTVYRNPRTGRLLAVPRHREIKTGLARQVMKDSREGLEEDDG